MQRSPWPLPTREATLSRSWEGCLRCWELISNNIVMHIRKVHIENFKRFYRSFDIELHEGINIVVGDNESGKSTIIEAIYLALTGLYNNKNIKNELTQFIFNQTAVEEYIESVRAGHPIELPSILIEIYLEGDDAALFKGDVNSDDEDCCGIFMWIKFDEQYNEEYAELIKSGIDSLPIEYYKVEWSSFAWNTSITSRSIPMKAALIDTSNAKSYNSSDIYVSRILKDNLDTKEVVDVTQAFRILENNFISDKKIEDLNDKINTASHLSDRSIQLAVDLSARNAWESILTAYLDKIPFTHIGKGEQNIIKTKLALAHKRAQNASIVLIEEPENHLSFSKMNELLYAISNECSEKQMLITTHSSFVANKLGLKNLILLSNNKTSRLNDLTEDTQDFFMKLSGYDTLRILLCKKAILVEGDSDELVVQRAYLDKYGKLPIEDNIDVISARNLSFLRYLEIAKQLMIPVCVVTDNDGDIDALERKYAAYKKHEYIKICYDHTIDVEPAEINGKQYNCNTLEPKILKANSRDILNSIFSTDLQDDNSLRKYMKENKTECALRIFNSHHKINYPQYILDAIE